MKFPVFSQLAGNFGFSRDEFAPDCFLQEESTANSFAVAVARHSAGNWGSKSRSANLTAFSNR
jgi:hypothetical protein